MLSENTLIYNLFDEFYLIANDPLNEPRKGKEFIKQNNTDFKFTGTNKNKTIFVYYDENQLSISGYEMLRNLVEKGIGWKIEEIVLINLSENADSTFKMLTDFFVPQNVITWGCDDFLNSNNIPIKIHEVQNWQNVKLLIAEDISAYHSNPSLKNLLWISIKKLFHLK